MQFVALADVSLAPSFIHGMLRSSLVERILWAWVLTLPAAGIVAYLTVKMFQTFGWIG